MGELREALKKAMREQCGCGGYAPSCAENTRNACYESFQNILRSLEESGWKLVGPEATPGMVRAAHAAKIFLNMTDAGWVAAHRAMLTAAPTVAELLEEKK